MGRSSLRCSCLARYGCPPDSSGLSDPLGETTPPMGQACPGHPVFEADAKTSGVLSRPFRGLRSRGTPLPRADALVVLHKLVCCPSGGRQNGSPGRQAWVWRARFCLFKPRRGGRGARSVAPAGLGEVRRGTLRFPGLTAGATTLTPSGLTTRRWGQSPMSGGATLAVVQARLRAFAPGGV